MKQKISLLFIIFFCLFSYSQTMKPKEKQALKQFIELLKINVDVSNNSIHPYIIEGLQLNGYILKKSAVKSKLNEVITNQQTRNTFLSFFGRINDKQQLYFLIKSFFIPNLVYIKASDTETLTNYILNNYKHIKEQPKEATRETKTEEPIIYTSCEKEAHYKGDLMQYLSEHISFPKIDVDKRIEKVTLKAQVIIDENGKVLIGDIDTKFSINGVYNSNDIKEFSDKYASEFQNELIKVLFNMPNWTPAQCGGKNSKSKKIIPFTFQVSE